MKPGSKAWKNFMAKLYGIGAAVVIVGALFKIQHWPGAGIMLTVGLLTEAIIFIFSAFEPIHEDPNWELVYPELALGHSDDLDHDALPAAKGGRNVGGSGVTDQLDKLLEEAKIDSELIGRLGDGMRRLGDNAAQLTSVTTAAAATDSYVNSLQAASQKVSSLSEAYERASVSISGLTSTTQEGESFGEQMQKVSKNLAALNNVYELQLKGSTQHLEATEKFQSQVTDMLQNLSASVEDTRLYKENMALLSKNLTDLNTVYGNMLKAMTITK
ncbi:gliding motility protein GldL [Crocinitomicaceae bacterium CZZ-1]|uniref:Gliding motility protein GldL n=1 Tax=Taishania pollutisoli TaxID=2766479 RepID=A0A8J6TY89_9FLAO|nr:gliding motility protein GldL [Taishania pollutisoli]MBC9810943.1 gliding motility protein GldL [Taishania pollutisoli]MBX2950100.1 gliding motility protein GldL [Crocinitomicaceae bacterium]